MPRVSFVIPVYDGDSFLAETLESCRNQTEKDIEIVIVDDASPDFTPELMEWYLKQDPRILYHRFEENQGVEKARNHGNGMASSDLICVLDQDDISMSNRAEYCITYFTDIPAVDCLTSAYWELDQEGVPQKQFNPNVITLSTLKDGTYLSSGGWLHSSACYRKKDILELPYRTEGGETDDYKFLIDWLGAGKVFHTTPEVLASKRMHMNREMNRRRTAQGLRPVAY